MEDKDKIKTFDEIVKGLINMPKLYELVLTEPGTASETLRTYIELVDVLMNDNLPHSVLSSEEWKNYHALSLECVNNGIPKE